METDRSSKRNTSYLVLCAFDHCSKKMRMREETPTLKDTLILPIMRKEALPQAMFYLRHFEPSSVKPQRRKTISDAFQAISSAVTTLHQVVSFSCAVNHRSRYLCSMLTQFGSRRQIWKMCKRASVTTIGRRWQHNSLGRLDMCH